MVKVNTFTFQNYRVGSQRVRGYKRSSARGRQNCTICANSRNEWSIKITKLSGFLIVITSGCSWYKKDSPDTLSKIWMCSDIVFCFTFQIVQCYKKKRKTTKLLQYGITAAYSNCVAPMFTLYLHLVIVVCNSCHHTVHIGPHHKNWATWWIYYKCSWMCCVQFLTLQSSYKPHRKTWETWWMYHKFFLNVRHEREGNQWNDQREKCWNQLGLGLLISYVFHKVLFFLWLDLEVYRIPMDRQWQKNWSVDLD